MSVVIEFRKVSKKYGDFSVLSEVDLEIVKGECFGILGPNGAGKTTLLKLLHGAASLQRGELFILGLNAKNNIKHIKSKLGIVPQFDDLDPEFSVEGNLHLFGSYHFLEDSLIRERISDLLKLMRLEDKALESVQNLSGGMKRRLAIARALINHPEIVVLDEPTTGLDLQARLWIWDFIQKIKSEMGTVVLTTHYIEEAEKICDRVAIVNKGQVIAIGTPQQLIRENIGDRIIEFETTDLEKNYFVNRLKSMHLKYQAYQNQIYIYLNPDQKYEDIITHISSPSITIRKAMLSDVFLKLTGHDLREETL